MEDRGNDTDRGLRIEDGEWRIEDREGYIT
jgi:hypothetical protein